MGKIQVNNIKLYANHGCLEEEAKIGSWYRVDVQVSFFLELDMITSATVSVAKLNPPIGGNVQEVAIILSKER